MKSIIHPISKVAIAALFISLTWACQKEEEEAVKKPAVNSTSAKVEQQRVSSAAENTQMVSAAMGVFEVTSASLVAKGVSGGRLTSFGSKTSAEIICLPNLSGNFLIESSNADSIVYTGTILLDFGTGTVCPGVKEIHKGKISDRFRLVIPNAEGTTYTLTEHVTFDSFQVDSVLVEGEFTGTSQRGTTSVKIENSKLTYPDGSSATLNASLYSILVVNEFGNSTKEVSGALNGVSADGISFSASSSKSLVFDFSCSPDVPVTGVVDISIGGSVSALDYGTGLCDNKYMLTTNDSVTVHEFKYSAL